jgi:phospholipase C
MSNNSYVKFRIIDNLEIRYERISNIIIPEAESTTAGFMLDFYDDLFRNKGIK